MKYRVVVDLGWHEADNPEQAIQTATSQKYKPEQMGYLAASEHRIIKTQSKHIKCSSSDCIEQSKEDMWAAYELRHDEWYEW